ncbi:MAG: PAS domain S-box protein [Candidatus Firestonebacteria bacterium]
MIKPGMFSKLDRYAAFYGAVSAILALFSLTGWLAGRSLTTILGVEFLPMTPDSAGVFFVLGILLSFSAFRKDHSKNPYIYSAALLIVLFFCLCLNLNTHFKVYPLAASMPPFIGWGFVAFSLAFLLKNNFWDGDFANNSAVIAGIIMAVFGLHIIVFQFHGLPVYFGPEKHQITIIGGFCALLQGLAIISLSGEKSMFLGPLWGTGTSQRIQRAITTFIIFGVAFQSLLLVVLEKLPPEIHALSISLEGIVFILFFTFLMRGVTEKIFKDSGKIEEKYSRIFDFSPVGITITRMSDGRFVEANEFAVKMIGLGREGLIGRSSLEIGLYSDPEDRKRIIKQLEEKGMTSGVETRLKTTAGEERLFNQTHQLIELSGEKLILTISEDISERRNDEIKLRESEEKFSKAFMESPDAISISSITPPAYIEINKGFTELTGYSVEETLGRSTLELKLFKDEADRERMLEQLKEKGRLNEFEVEMITKKGESKSVLLTMSIIEYRGSKHVLALIHNITERRKLEEQLLQARKMDALGTLVGGVAHDFNNMLAIIIGYSELTIELAEKQSEIKQNVTEIRQTAERAAALTAQLLAFSRKQPLKRSVLALNSSLDEIKKMLKRIIGEDIEFEFEPGPGLKNIYADKAQLDQVIINLITNSRDAMPKGGKLSIKTENVTLDAESCGKLPGSRPGKFVCMVVKDSGLGISPEQQKHLFEPFYTTKPFGRGSGLGLSVIHGIVEQQEGWINVFSEEGKGAEFRVYFPAVKEKTPADSGKIVPEPPSKTGNGEKILIVEDEEILRNMLVRILKQNKYTVLQAESGAEALRLFGKEKSGIDLLFSDSVMPGMKGLELAKKLKSLNPDMKVIVSSGYLDDKSDVGEIEKAGYEFLAKPYDLKDLFAKIARVLQK